MMKLILQLIIPLSNKLR